MAERVTTSPVRLCSRDGKICYYWVRRLEHDFLFLCLASFFPSFSPSLFGYVSLVRTASSVQQSSAPRLQHFRRVYLCHCILLYLITIFVLYDLHFFVFLVILGRRVCCAFVPDTLSIWFAYFGDSPLFCFGVSLFDSLWPHKSYLSRMKNQDGHWVYCWWCRWVERTVWCEDDSNNNIVTAVSMYLFVLLFFLVFFY